MYTPYRILIRGLDMAFRLTTYALAALTACSALSAQAQTLSVPTLTVASAAGSAQQSLDATIQAVKQATVAAQVPGNIIERTVKAGDAVKAGATLMRIDSRDSQAAFEMRQADVAQAQAQWQVAKLQWERQQALRAQGFISAAALDGAEAQWKAAQAALAAAQAGRQQAALAKGYAQVQAPFSGLILSTHAEVGDLAGPGRPLVTLYAPGAMRAVVQVPASMASSLKSAKQIEVWTGQSWVSPQATTTLPGADPVSQTVEWRLDLPASAKDVIPGQSVTVRWSGAAVGATGMQVPSSAVLRRGELNAVYVVRDGRFVLQAVRTGHAKADGAVAVWSGLKAGDRIAVDAVKAGLAGATPNTK